MQCQTKAQGLGQKPIIGYKKITKILHYQGLLFVSKFIQIELISCHYNNCLASHCGIEKTCELLAQKYY